MGEGKLLFDLHRQPQLYKPADGFVIRYFFTALGLADSLAPASRG
jgi:hypothetical protein